MEREKSDSLSLGDLVKGWGRESGEPIGTVLKLIALAMQVNLNSKFPTEDDRPQVYEPIWDFDGGLPEEHREGEQAIIDALELVASQGELDVEAASLRLKREPLVRLFEREEVPVPLILSPPRYVYRDRGQSWEIGLVSRSAMFPKRNGKGLAYIRYLIQHPDIEISPVDLITNVEGSPILTELPDRIGDEFDNLSATLDGQTTDIGEGLDLKARRTFHIRVDELRSELESAEETGNSGRVQEINDEIRFYEKQFADDYRERRTRAKARPHTQRASDKVRKNIERAIDRISENSPEIAANLTSTIRCRSSVSYSASRAKPVKWLIS